MKGRIWFADSPWPNGHEVATFSWTARVDTKSPTGPRLFFDLDLHTVDYDAEGPGLVSSDGGSWASPGVWCNYHACRLTSEVGILAATQREPLDLDSWPGVTYLLDKAPKKPDQSAFRMYLLGHDSVAKHELRFARRDSGTYDLAWSGWIRLSYSGGKRYEHRFTAKIDEARLEYIRVPSLEGLEDRAREALAKVVRGGDRLLYVRRGQGFAFAETR